VTSGTSSITFDANINDDLSSGSAALTGTWSGGDVNYSKTIYTTGSTRDVYADHQTLTTPGEQTITFTLTGDSGCSASKTMTVDVIKLAIDKDPTYTEWTQQGDTHDLTDDLTTDSYDSNWMLWEIDGATEPGTTQAASIDDSDFVFGSGGGSYTIYVQTDDPDLNSEDQEDATYTLDVIKVAVNQDVKDNGNTAYTAWTQEGDTHDLTDDLSEDSYDTDSMTWELTGVITEPGTTHAASIPDEDSDFYFGSGGGSYTITVTSEDLSSVTTSYTLDVIKVAFDQYLVEVGWVSNSSYNAAGNLTADSYDTNNLTWTMTHADGSALTSGDSYIDSNNGSVTFGTDDTGGHYKIAAASKDPSTGVYDYFDLDVDENCKVQILSPKGTYFSTANDKSAWSSGDHWDFQGVASASPDYYPSPGFYNIPVKGSVSDGYTPDWSLDSDVGTLSSTSDLAPTLTPTDSVTPGIGGVWGDLTLFGDDSNGDPAGSDMRGLVIYMDWLDMDYDNFGASQSCSSGMWTTPFGHTKNMNVWNCFGSCIHAYDGSGTGYQEDLGEIADWTDETFSPTGLGSIDWYRLTTHTKRGDVIAFYTGIFPIYYKLTHAHTALVDGGEEMWGADNQPMGTDTYFWAICTSEAYFNANNTNPNNSPIVKVILFHRPSQSMIEP
jgi:hypothetical protein